MKAKCALVFFGALFIRSGYAQCDQSIIIGNGIMTTATINTTIVPTCFICLTSSGEPAPTPIVFSIDVMTLTINAAITIAGHQLMVSNFTGFPLLDGVQNKFECIDALASLRYRGVTTLNPIQPEYLTTPSEFYVEGSTNQVICVNRNVGPFLGGTFWIDPLGKSVGNGGLLQLIEISKSQEGLYICAVILYDETVSVEIPTLSFTLVVHYLSIRRGGNPPRISTNRCPSGDDNEDILLDVLKLLSSEFGIVPLGLAKSYAATSCQQVASANPRKKAGLYWITNGTNLQQQFCDF